MPQQLEFDDDTHCWSRIRRAHMRFPARWRVTNTGDETSEEGGGRIDLIDVNGPLKTPLGRAVRAERKGRHGGS